MSEFKFECVMQIPDYMGRVIALNAYRKDKIVVCCENGIGVYDLETKKFEEYEPAQYR